MTSFSYYGLALLVCGNKDSMTTGGLEQHFCLFYWGENSQPAVFTRYPILYAMRTNLHQLLEENKQEKSCRFCLGEEERHVCFYELRD